jgi:hypothetical protein
MSIALTWEVPVIVTLGRRVRRERRNPSSESSCLNRDLMVNARNLLITGHRLFPSGPPFQ